jgi:hypothetical protein
MQQKNNKFFNLLKFTYFILDVILFLLGDIYDFTC